MTPLSVVTLLGLVIEFVVGIVANGLIVGLNCIAWIKSKKLDSCALVLISLGTSRFFLLCTLLVNNIFFIIPKMNNEQCNTWRAFYFIWMYLSTLSLWFATWLAVFYCVKITSFNQHLFLWLKLRLSGLLPWLILGSLLVSLATSLPTVNAIHIDYLNNSINNLSRNITVACIYETNTSPSFLILTMFGHYSPFVLFFVPSLLLVTSLLRHTKRMGENMSTSRDTSAEAHIRAIKALLSFIVLYIFYMVAQVVTLSKKFAASSPYLLWFCIMILAGYPLVHSVILILSNPKLKEAALKGLRNARCLQEDESQ
ncbi:PREDICTED: taste receptor type 2 member 7-like [Gavialis gangeticus]|uniref:taste receptor type 2 member 7-like n=1 Tax=Gavialis gangeticus TaxID=94835 RepID=UPI00092FA0E5|nr:PREDICTED: taste receptor type 2 member 7-like [Gavialis gangeticus]